MTFRVMCGWSAIWAGNAKELKDGAITMTGAKHNVREIASRYFDKRFTRYKNRFVRFCTTNEVS